MAAVNISEECVAFVLRAELGYCRSLSELCQSIFCCYNNIRQYTTYTDAKESLNKHGTWGS